MLTNVHVYGYTIFTTAVAAAAGFAATVSAYLITAITAVFRNTAEV